MKNALRATFGMDNNAFNRSYEILHVLIEPAKVLPTVYHALLATLLKANYELDLLALVDRQHLT